MSPLEQLSFSNFGIKTSLQTCKYHLSMLKGGSYSLQGPSEIRDAHSPITCRIRLT